ncbi:MAG: hypothetical protein R3338_08310, partial [Thermoanaerobaculia bacterium]|nr:hypothetical protein [Thermoanaerobaculia bacterium]
MLRQPTALAVPLFLSFLLIALIPASADGQSCPIISAVSPTESARVTSPVTFEWTQDTNASYYHMEIDELRGSSWIRIHDIQPVYETSYDLSMAPGEYRWSVHSSGGPCHEIDTPFMRFEVFSAPLPAILNFDSSPQTIRSGESTTLLWSTRDADGVVIDGGVGSQPPNGSAVVTPSQTTTYALTASGDGGSTTAQVTVRVITTPEVIVAALPEPMVQGTSSGGATASYVLKNVGGASTSISLSQQGDFFGQSPTSFTLEPGQSQRITLTGLQRDTGSFRGASIPSGSGLPSGTSIAVRLLSVPTPSGPTAAEPEAKRIDVVAPPGTNPTGSAVFRNTGEAKIQASAVSTVPWLLPPDELIEVDPGQSVTIPFGIDRTLRSTENEIGSTEGKLALVFRDGPSGKGAISARNGAAASSSLVTVVDTSAPEAVPGEIPPLSPGEVALFIPGAGHVEGGPGLFFSDIALVNLKGSRTLNDIDLYYTPIGSTETKTTTLSQLATGTPVQMADIVRTVFNAESTLGTLQIRAPDVDDLSVNANILLRKRTGEQKTYGNTIPALRSDRSVEPGGSVWITGLTRTETSHTNLFAQETAGGNVTVDFRFFDESGQLLGERLGIEVQPFQLAGLFFSNADPIMPLGSVSAVITSRPESTGRFAAYATPVDDVSGDSWSLVDWNAQNGFAGSENMLIPVAGALRGGGGLFFRTDLAVINRGDTPASGILRYIRRPEENAPPVDRTIELAGGESVILADVTSTLFEIDPAQINLGFMKFFPQSGAMTVTSRNFATLGDDPGTFGTGVATLPLAGSMRVGEVKRIGAVKDASLETVNNAVPGSFRSNIGIMETTGTAPVTVRVTVHFTFSTGTTAVARGTGSKEYT